MAKALYRYLRGELNGHYLQAIYSTLNKTSLEIRNFLVRFKQVQFTTDSMTSEEIYNIGKFAGVFLPLLSSGENFGAFRMTESNIVNDKERSERGLLNRQTENFDFFHTEQDEYNEDINTLATSDLKSSMVGDEERQGYIYSDEVDLFDSEGNVKEDKVKSVPAVGQAYTEFFGNQFTFLSENIITKQNLPVELFYPLYKILQTIRYNGASIGSLVELIDTLCPNGLVKIQSIEKYETLPLFVVNYVYNPNVVVNLRTQRLATLRYVVGLKFPQFLLNEVTSEVN